MKTDRAYGFSVFWSDEDESYIAVCPEFPGLSALGDTPEAAVREAEITLRLFIEEYEKDAVPLPEPQTYSGKTIVRMPKSLHAALASLADREGVSLNMLIITMLSRLPVLSPQGEPKP